MNKDLRAELLVYEVDGMFDYNAAYLRDGGTANVLAGWRSAGTFDTVHDALTEGKERLKAAKRRGLKRGNKAHPRIWTKAA